MERIMVFLCLLAFWTTACKEEKKTSLTGEEPVEVADFISFFEEVNLPFTAADSTLNKKTTDSSLIAYTVFTEFVPDSVLQKDFGKAKPKLYPLGRSQEKGKETYLFAKAILGKKKVVYLVCFDKKNKYLNTLPIVKAGFDTYTSRYGMLDKKFQITTYREKKTPAGELNFKRNVYIYNSASNDFTLIMTEPNADIMEDIINPIDTLSQKNKYTGDYEANKKNFVSFRDGRNESEIQFFTHFEKNKGECVGELKGTARFVSAKVAQYRENGSPCSLQFTFTSSAVVMKELEGCGMYRDIKCFFDYTFPKKKRKQAKSTKEKK